MASVIAGTFTVDAHIFERWGAYENFLNDIKEICAILQYRTNHRFELDQRRLEVAHERIKAHESAWLEHLLPEGTTHLSHLKLVSIYVEALAELGPIAVCEAMPTLPSGSYQDGGPGHYAPPKPIEARELRKFTDGQTHMVAWLIGYHICEFFEANRIDRIDPYVSRTTDEFETDLVSGLLSGRVSAQALHLILKALFLRD